MSTQVQYLGKTKIYSCADNFWRTWFVWASCEFDGELICVRYNNIDDMNTSIELLSRSQCDTLLKRKIWQFAEEAVWKTPHDDVIIETAEPLSDNVINMWEHRNQ